MTTNEYQVTGMSCGHCEDSVREEVGDIGLQVLDVNARTGRLVVAGPAEIDDDQVLAAVAEAGYSAVRV